MSIRPLDNKVALGAAPATVMLPVAVNVPAPGSYNSAGANCCPQGSVTTTPPAISTIPSGSNVAECSLRSTTKLPVEANLPASCSSGKAP